MNNPKVFATLGTNILQTSYENNEINEISGVKGVIRSPINSYKEAQKRNQIRKELDDWEKKVIKAVEDSSSDELYTMWSMLSGTRKRKPKKSYWYSKEAIKTTQRLLDRIGAAAREKEDKTSVDIEEAIKIFGGDL